MNIRSGSGRDPMYRNLNVNNRNLRSNEDINTDTVIINKLNLIFLNPIQNLVQKKSECSESESEVSEVAGTALAERSHLRTVTWFREAVPH